jgi:hypothetical protein
VQSSIARANECRINLSSMSVHVGRSSLNCVLLVASKKISSSDVTTINPDVPTTHHQLYSRRCLDTCYRFCEVVEVEVGAKIMRMVAAQ